MERWHSSVTMKSKVSMGNRGVVGHVFRAVVGGGDFEAGFFVEVFVQLFAAEHGVKALDGADGDAANAIELVRGEVLDVVELGELAAVGGDELLELGHGLASEIGAIDEEEDVARAGMLDEPVGERAGGECLAGAGGHLDEGARLRFGEGLLEAADGFDAADADVFAVVRMLERHLGEAVAEGVGFFEPLGQRFRAMEREDAARSGMRIAFVAEEGFDAGGFVEEREVPG